MIQQLHSFALALSLIFQAVAAQEIHTLEPGKPVEREIAGSESHSYQTSLQAGQFVRFRLAQRTVDTALTLSAPDGKPIVVMDLVKFGSEGRCRWKWRQQGAIN